MKNSTIMLKNVLIRLKTELNSLEYLSAFKFIFIKQKISRIPHKPYVKNLLYV